MFRSTAVYVSRMIRMYQKLDNTFTEERRILLTCSFGLSTIAPNHLFLQHAPPILAVDTADAVTEDAADDASVSRPDLYYSILDSPLCSLALLHTAATLDSPLTIPRWGGIIPIARLFSCILLSIIDPLSTLEGSSEGGDSHEPTQQ